MIYLSSIRVAPTPQMTHTEVVAEALRRARALAHVTEGDDFEVFISRENIDARRGRELGFVFRVAFRYKKSGVSQREKAEARLYGDLVKTISSKKNFTVEKCGDLSPFEAYWQEACFTTAPKRPVIVGFGPAGMFLALMLARAGFCPLIVERGKKADERAQDIERFSREGVLNPNSNVQFGEGGAGTFSDGKLASGVKDPEGIGRFVLRELKNFGAPEEILYESKPHVGTDKLRVVVQNVRKEVERLGGEFYFETRFVDYVTDSAGRLKAVVLERDHQTETIETEACFLALGHSARDTFEKLYQKDVHLERKPFAMGFRVEHPQKWLNETQYREYAHYASLGAADYKLAVTTRQNRGVYTFCMCPGGVVMPAASEEGGVCTNGMSYYARAEENANSAVLVTIAPEDFEKAADFGGGPLAGVSLQRSLERKAFEMGGKTYAAPAQRVGDYLTGRVSKDFGAVSPSYAKLGVGVTPSDLNQIFPDYMNQAFQEGLVLLDQKIAGFKRPDAVMTGVEARSSSPVRIVRDEVTLQSSVPGLYPVGEGAGYAGGIMSAAMDGIKSARAYLTSFLG